MQTEGTKKPGLTQKRIVMVAVAAIVVLAASATAIIYQKGGHPAGAESSASIIANEPSDSATSSELATPSAIATASDLSLPSDVEQPSASVAETASTASPNASGLPVTLRAPRYPAHKRFVASSSNETTGHAKLSIANVQDNQGRFLDIAESDDLSIVCSWTSPISVRPYFFQRVKVLGENADIDWSVGSTWDGEAAELGAQVELSEGVFQSDRGVDAGFYPLDHQSTLDPSDHPRKIARTLGSVSGSITDRVDLLLTAIAEVSPNYFVSADMSLTWDCGSAPAGVKGTLRPDPTGTAYDDWMGGKGFHDAVVVSGNTRIPALRTGCGAGLGADALGNSGDVMCTADEDATPLPIPAYKPVKVLSQGSTIEISVPGGFFQPQTAAMTFTTTTKSYKVYPESDGYRLVYKLPAPGTYNCSVQLGWLDDLAWSWWSGYAFSVEVK